MRIYEKNFKGYVKIRETAALMKLNLSMNLKKWRLPHVLIFFFQEYFKIWLDCHWFLRPIHKRSVLTSILVSFYLLISLINLPVVLCSGLEKSPFGAKSDFELRAFKGFLYMYKKISPKKGLEVFTPKNLKWKKYIRQSENANGTPLEPLWGSK